MDPFESLQQVWQSAAKDGGKPIPALLPGSINSRKKLLRDQKKGAIFLLITGIYLIGVGYMMRQTFQSALTWIGLGLVIMVCWGQAALQYLNVQRLRAIDETSLPAVHLAQWQAYYAHRQQQIKWNMPLYFILLNVSVGIYMVEIYRGRPLEYVLLFLTIYTAWMFFAYFYLGKKAIRREKERLGTIIDNLTSIKQQWEAV